MTCVQQRRALYYSLPTFLFSLSFYCRLFFLAVQINGKLEEEESKLGCMIWRRYFSAPSYPWPTLFKLRLPLKILTKMHKLENSIPWRISCLLDCLACFHIDYREFTPGSTHWSFQQTRRYWKTNNNDHKFYGYHQNDLTSLEILSLQSD